MRYKSVYAMEWISNSVVQKITWFLYFDLCKCISFFKTRLKKPFHRCNFRSTNSSLETDCIIFLCNSNSDAMSYILERMEINHLFFGKEIKDVKRVM